MAANSRGNTKEKSTPIRNTNRWDTRTLVTMALLAAIGALLSFIELGNFGGFLRFDASFVPALTGGLLLGVGPGIAIGVVTWLIHGLIAADLWGALTNMIGIACFVAVSAGIYWRKPSSKRAIVGLAVSCVTNLVVMLVLNLLLVPIYTGVATADVIPMIVPLLLPFNIFKGVVDCLLAYLLFRPLQGMLAKGKK